MNKKKKGLVYLVIALFFFIQAYLNYFLIPTNLLANLFGFEPNFNSFALNIIAIGPMVVMIVLFIGFILFVLEKHYTQNKEKSNKLNIIILLKEKAFWIVINGFLLLVTYVLTGGYIIATIFQKIQGNDYFIDRFIYFYIFMYFFIWFIAYYVYGLEFKNNLKQKILTILLLSIAIISPAFFSF
jgi:hypothetical protein